MTREAAGVEHGYVDGSLVGVAIVAATTWEAVLLRAANVGLLVLGALVITRLATRAVGRFMRTLRQRSPVRSASVRAEQRLSTIADVLTGLVRAVVWTVAVLLVLGEVGVQLAPLLAGAGIAGIAIGFGAQSLVRDFLSGFFILLEDQYGVGDVIDLGDVTGTVEDISLRVTRVRATDGTVWFVPNGEIKRVGNSSMEWSRALIDVMVAYGTDVPGVIGSLRDVATRFTEDPAWADVVLEAPEVWGVQAMGADGLTIRLVVKTAPRQQYAVARELRGRITERLRREGVQGPGKTVQTVLVTAGALDTETPPPPPPAAPTAP